MATMRGPGPITIAFDGPPEHYTPWVLPKISICYTMAARGLRARVLSKLATRVQPSRPQAKPSYNIFV